MKKLAVALLAICLLMTTIAGGVGAIAEDETVKFTFGVIDDPVVTDWETNYLSLYIEEKVGVDLEFVLLPYNDAERLQKLEMMVTAGGADLPDIIMGSLDFATAQAYGAMGMLVPLNDYVDNMPLLDESLAAMIASPVSKEEYLRYCTSNDGNIYGLGGVSMTPNNSVRGCRIMVYGPWKEAFLEATGAEDIITTEDFKDYLIFVRDNDMNGNGDPNDEVPLTGFNPNSFNNNFTKGLMNPFVYTQDNFYINNEGTIEFAAIQDGWKEGIEYIKSLYDEKLFSSMAITQDRTSFNSQVSTDPTTVGAFAWISTSNLATTDPRREEYVIVGALEGPEGIRQACVYPNIPSSIYIAVSKNCKDIEKAVEVIDVIASPEFQIINRYGIEGENWISLTGDDIGTSMYASMGFPGDKLTTKNIYGTENNVQWQGHILVFNDGSTYTLREKDISVEGTYNHSRAIGAGITKELDYRNTENAVFGLLFTDEESAVITEYRAIINSTVQEMFAKFITGEIDVEEGWDAYVTSLYDMGLETYLGAVQSAWDRLNAN